MSASDISAAMAGEAQRRYEEAVAGGAKAPKVAPKFEALDLESCSGRYHTVTCLDVMIHYPQVTPCAASSLALTSAFRLHVAGGGPRARKSLGFGSRASDGKRGVGGQRELLWHVEGATTGSVHPGPVSSSPAGPDSHAAPGANRTSLAMPHPSLSSLAHPSLLPCPRTRPTP